MSAKPFTIAEVEISRFPKANKPDEVEKSTIGAFIEECRSDRWRDLIRRIRSAGTEAERRQIKTEELAVFTPSGMFSRRDKAGLQSHSGAIIADVDHLRSKGINPEELRDKLAKDPHVVMACISPSGDGVKALVRVFPDASLHEAYFHQAAEYFRKTYDVEMDPSGKDVSRACFATHDPGLKDNINARVMELHGGNGSGPDFQAGAQGMDDSGKPYQWPLPVPLEEALPDVPPLDAALIPPEIRPWIIDIAERMQCSIDLIFHGAVVMYGALAGTAVRLRPKEHDNWEVTPNFYGGCVAPPGSMKTPAMAGGFGIVDRLEIQGIRATRR